MCNLYCRYSPFEVQGLLYHNSHRRLHKADDLHLDSSYARRLVVRQAPIQIRPGQGENIFLRCKTFDSVMECRPLRP